MDSPSAKTCIIATLGPASDSLGTIRALIEGGVNIFRLNFSHGTRDEHEARFRRVHQAAAEVSRPIGLLQDLQGPKIRIGKVTQPVKLEVGHTLVLDGDLDGPGDGERIGMTYRGLARDVARGDRLLVDDGHLELEVRRTEGRRVVTTVVRGGRLSSSKGLNVPGSDLRVPALSDKDVDDLKFGAALGVDWLAISFVRSRDDVFLARHYLERFHSAAKLMAKIEKPSAVTRFAQILDASDGIMIARGDLGVELSPEQVPLVQKNLVKAAREAGKPVVIATQMLESMTHSPIPTRAEASDVANAILDGTDAVMLSGETAVGDYPVETVRFMNTVARQVESDPTYQATLRRQLVTAGQEVPDSVAMAACKMAMEIGAKVIVTFSSSGATALRVARYRVAVPVLAITPNATAYRQLAVSWGLDAVLTGAEIQNSDEMVAQANAFILRKGLAQPGDAYLMTAGVPFGVAGTTNLIRVEMVTEAQ